MMQICERNPTACSVQTGAANVNARFLNFLSDRVTTKSARDEDRKARLDWRDDMNKVLQVSKHRREMSLYGLGSLRGTF